MEIGIGGWKWGLDLGWPVELCRAYAACNGYYFGRLFGSELRCVRA